MSSASPLSNGSAIYKRFLEDYNLKTESHKISEIRLLLTIVILFFLLDVSTKHFIDKGYTASQNETTGSTYKQKHIHQEKKIIKFYILKGWKNYFKKKQREERMRIGSKQLP